MGVDGAPPVDPSIVARSSETENMWCMIEMLSDALEQSAAQQDVIYAMKQIIRGRERTILSFNTSSLVFLLCMLNDGRKIDTIRSQIDTHTKRIG